MVDLLHVCKALVLIAGPPRGGYLPKERIPLLCWNTSIAHRSFPRCSSIRPRHCTRLQCSEGTIFARARYIGPEVWVCGIPRERLRKCVRRCVRKCVREYESVEVEEQSKSEHVHITVAPSLSTRSIFYCPIASSALEFPHLSFPLFTLPSTNNPVVQTSLWRKLFSQWCPSRNILILRFPLLLLIRPPMGFSGKSMMGIRARLMAMVVSRILIMSPFVVISRHGTSLCSVGNAFAQ